MGEFGCRRPLDNLELAEDFVKKVFEDCGELHDAAAKIVLAEIEILKLEPTPTKTHTNNRISTYRNAFEREKLLNSILKELISLEQEEDDDIIKPNKGGAKPKEPLQKDSLAFIVSGAPASGKSAIAKELAKSKGAYILDSDFAKRKIPEYSKFTGGASLVHEEARDIIFGSANNNKSLFEYCVYNGFNIVIPLVGKSLHSVIDICERLKSANYKVHFVNVALDRYKCVQRAYLRFISTGRYVPLSYIFDEVGNEPELVYYHLKREYYNDFESFSQLSTDVQKGESPIIIECSPQSLYFSVNQPRSVAIK